MSLVFHESLNQSKRVVVCISPGTVSFERLLCLLISEKHENDVEYVLKLKIAFYSNEKTIIHWVSLIKSQYFLNEKDIMRVFFSWTHAIKILTVN